MRRELKTGSVPALERALAILERLARSRQGLTLSQLARYLELPKSSTHCLLMTFERCGYLNRDAHTGRYRLGLRFCGLARAALRSVEIRDVAAPFLRQLQERTGLTVNLAIPEHGEVVIVDKYEPPAAARVGTWLGKCMDLHCTALGKALAAYLPEEQLDERIRARGLLRHNDNTICNPRRLKQELALIRERGYSFDDEEEEIGVRCVGARILGPGGEMAGAISVTGSVAEIDAANTPRLAAEVMATAQAISAALAETGRERPAESVPPALDAGVAPETAATLEVRPEC
jgi:DNA-binding IclR family transcriptional regulator